MHHITLTKSQAEEQACHSSFLSRVYETIQSSVTVDGPVVLPARLHPVHACIIALQPSWSRCCQACTLGLVGSAAGSLPATRCTYICIPHRRLPPSRGAELGFEGVPECPDLGLQPVHAAVCCCNSSMPKPCGPGRCHGNLWGDASVSTSSIISSVTSLLQLSYTACCTVCMDAGFIKPSACHLNLAYAAATAAF